MFMRYTREGTGVFYLRKCHRKVKNNGNDHGDRELVWIEGPLNILN